MSSLKDKYAVTARAIIFRKRKTVSPLREISPNNERRIIKRIIRTTPVSQNRFESNIIGRRKLMNKQSDETI